MIYAKDLFRLEKVQGLRQVAGRAGLERPLKAAVLFEYDSQRLQSRDYYRDDLVLLTLAYAREDATLLTSSLMRLIWQGVGALLIKTGYYSELPDAVLREAERTATPIFLFDESYIEEALLEATELIRGWCRFAGFEKDLDELMREALADDQVRQRLHRIDPGWTGEGRVYAIAAGTRNAEVSEALFRCPQAKADCVFMAWRSLLLAIIHHPPQEDAFAPLEAIFAHAGVNTEGLFLGASSPCPAAECIGGSLCEAVYAVRAAQACGQPRMEGKDMGLYAFLLPMSENAFACRRARCLMDRLAAYDRSNHAETVQTARAYIENGRDVPRAAKAIYQHPNTVRYRLGKIRKIVGIEDEATFQSMLELAVRLSDIAQRGV